MPAARIGSQAKPLGYTPEAAALGVETLLPKKASASLMEPPTTTYGVENTDPSSHALNRDSADVEVATETYDSTPELSKADDTLEAWILQEFGDIVEIV